MTNLLRRRNAHVLVLLHADGGPQLLLLQLLLLQLLLLQLLLLQLLLLLLLLEVLGLVTHLRLHHIFLSHNPPHRYTTFLLKHRFPLLSFSDFSPNSENVKMIFFPVWIVTLTRWHYTKVENSAADSGCLFRIPHPNFSIPDLGSRVKRFRNRIRM